MREFIAFILPLATALTGMRLSRLVLGQKFENQFGIGFRFLFGLAVGMLVFTQALLASALAGVNAAGFLAWLAIIWGGVETVLLARKLPSALTSIKFQPGHLWLLLLLPLLYWAWVFGRLSTLEGTLGFDANAFWVFKSKILYLEQGRNLLHVLHQSNLGYTHMDYPMLVPCLYTLGYGAVGGVDEFVNKVWPFWLMVALMVGILSLARIWKVPRLLPIAVVTLVAFLPATLEFIRMEGGAIPMVFYVSLATLVMGMAISGENELAPAACILAFAGCFSTKFEGVVYAAVCFCIMLPIGLRRGWLKSKILWKSAAVATVCLLPYLFFRLAKPVLHPQSEWLHAGLAAPLSVLHRFPQVWFLNVCARFFSSDFFHWQAHHDHLQWIGHWAGWSTFANDQLSMLPWLLLILLGLSIVCKSRNRLALTALSAAVLGVFTILSFVIACLPNMQSDLASVIDFSSSGEVGRYYYPFFVAWFLGIVAAWLADERIPPAQTPGSEKKSSPASGQNQKRRR